MKVERSTYLVDRKPYLRELVDELNRKYDYASVLATDCKAYQYSVSMRGIDAKEDSLFSERGFVVRVNDGSGIAEYSFNEIGKDSIPEIVKAVDEALVPFKASVLGTVNEIERTIPEEEETVFLGATEYEIHPETLGSEAIIERLSAIREKTLHGAEGIMDAGARLSYQVIHKMFLSAKKDMEQNVMWTCGNVSAFARSERGLKSSGDGFSVLGGAELLDKMEKETGRIAKTAIELTHAEPLPPGEYECVCTPSVTGMIVHEAFGHGVEMDMFVKDRAMAKYCVGTQVASPIVTMRDSAKSINDAGSYFFDDEGTMATDTVIIENGILKRGISDLLAASKLGTEPTGNGRRMSFERKAYTRMTNTIFQGGKDKVEDMIKSVKSGLLLDEPTSGMEDPKNWGIQCMVSFGREIKDGKLTGRIFSPIVLTGFVPDLLRSITMMSEDAPTCGSGYCGKGYKEWVKVSDGGPYIKATIRLG